MLVVVLKGEAVVSSDEVDGMVRLSSVVLEKIRAATNPSRRWLILACNANTW